MLAIMLMMRDMMMTLRIMIGPVSQEFTGDWAARVMMMVGPVAQEFALDEADMMMTIGPVAQEFALDGAAMITMMMVITNGSKNDQTCEPRAIRQQHRQMY